MFGFGRRRAERAIRRRRPAIGRVEGLESRQLMAANPLNPHIQLSDGINYHYFPTLLRQNTRETGTPPLYFNHPIGTPSRQLSFLDNDGKVLTGTDREGDAWQITVHGPGAVIVTDATPNDGALDDDINTIQLVGTDPRRTVVTGHTTGSARVITDGTVRFYRLISESGVKEIVLNGFTLSPTVAPTEEGQFFNEGPEIYLPNGVRLLQFHNIEAPIDLAFVDQPIDIVIGDANSPLRVRPTIRLDSIFNTVFDSAVPFNPPGVPQTTPTVNILVNGQLHGLEMVSSTSFPIEPAGFQFAFPTSSVTGRTAIRALGVGRVKAVGSLRNTTLSRNAVPFQNGLSGLNRLRRLEVGGVTDGLGVDVSRGRIGRIKLIRGLGDPTGALTGAVNFGVPEDKWGNAAYGLLGGQVVARSIRGIEAGPANTVLQSVQDPDFAQQRRTNSTLYFSRPGRALTNAAIVTDGSTSQVNIVGDLQGSEIKTGANFRSFTAGLEPVRAPSRIRPIRVKGNLIDSDVTSTYRTGPDRRYGTLDPATGQTDDEAGNGLIQGELVHGALYETGGQTALSNRGVGFYARRKIGYLPPPSRPKRVHGVNVGF
jgi:hypothetical protein